MASSYGQTAEMVPASERVGDDGGSNPVPEAPTPFQAEDVVTIATGPNASSRGRVMTLDLDSRGAGSAVPSVRERMALFSLPDSSNADPSIRRRGGVPHHVPPAPAGPRWQGVSVGYLRRFLAAINAQPDYRVYTYASDGTRERQRQEILATELTTFECAEQYVKPTSAPLDGPLCSSAAPGEIANATVFVSHAWRYKIVEVLEQLILFGEAEPENHFFWLDIVMVDQNNAPNLPKEFWTTTFKSAIAAIGRTVLVLSPWDDPIPLTRAWCLYEIYSTLISPGVKFDVVLPDAERAALKAAVMLRAESDLRSEDNAVLDTMMRVDTENAQCYMPADREMIFAAVRATDGGFHHVNLTVKALLRDWLLGQLKHMVSVDAAAAESAPPADRKTEKVLSDFNTFSDEVGNILLLHDEHAMALECYQKALSLLEARYDPRLPSTVRAKATAYHNLAGVHTELGRSDTALELYGKALEIWEAVPDNLNAAETLYNIGIAHAKRGGYATALQCNQKAVKIFEDALGLDHPMTAVGYNNLGSVCSSSGELDKALEWHGKALAIRKRALGTGHEHTVESLMNVGNCLRQQKNYTAALKNYTQGVVSLELLYGKVHHKTAMGYGNVASIYADTGQPNRALPEQLKALSIMAKIHGPVHPNTAPFHKNISDTYLDLGDLRLAMVHALQALAGCEPALGPEHPQTIGCYKTCSSVCSLSGDLDEAVRYSLKAISATEAMLSAEHPDDRTVDLGLAISNLGCLVRTRGRRASAAGNDEAAAADFAQAVGHCSRAVRMLEADLGPHHTTTADAAYNLGLVLYTAGDFAAALKCYERATAVYTTAKGREHPETMKRFKEQASCRFCTGEFQAALEILLAAANIEAEALGQEHPETRQTYGNISLAYASLGDATNAEKYRRLQGKA